MVEHGVVGGVPLLQAGGGHARQVAHAAVVRPATNNVLLNLTNETLYDNQTLASKSQQNMQVK